MSRLGSGHGGRTLRGGMLEHFGWKLSTEATTLWEAGTTLKWWQLRSFHDYSMIPLYSVITGELGWPQGFA